MHARPRGRVAVAVGKHRMGGEDLGGGKDDGEQGDDGGQKRVPGCPEFADDLRQRRSAGEKDQPLETQERLRDPQRETEGRDCKQEGGDGAIGRR